MTLHAVIMAGGSGTRFLASESAGDTQAVIADGGATIDVANDV